MLSQVDEARLAWHSERIKEGMERARDRGTRIGRPRILNSYRLRPEFVTAEKRINSDELPIGRAAKELGIGYNTLKRLLAARDGTDGLTESLDTST